MRRPSMLWRRGLVVLLAALILALPACGTANARLAASATPTATFIPLRTPTWARAITQLTIPVASTIAAAPNGSSFAQLDDGPPASVTIYDLTGKAHGHYIAPAGYTLSMLWLPDSTGLVLWKTATQDGAAGPLGIMDVNGSIHQTGFTAAWPSISPDGQWIAGTAHVGQPGGGDVQVVARAGSTPRTVARGNIIGWLGNRIVYANNGIFAVNRDGSDNRQLGPDVGISVGQQESSPFVLLSPDGTVLLAYGAHGYIWRISLSGVTRVAYPDLAQVPGLWAGPHAAYGLLGGTISTVDVLTGATLSQTGVSTHALYVEGFAGDWVAAIESAQNGALHVLNLTTKEDDALVSLAGPLQIYPLGTTKFLVKVNGTPPALYVVDPALAGE